MVSNIQPMPERDEDTGRYVAEYSEESFKDAIRKLGRDASTSAIAEEVDAGYDTAYRKLVRMEADGKVASRKIANARLWQLPDDGETDD